MFSVESDAVDGSGFSGQIQIQATNCCVGIWNCSSEETCPRSELADRKVKIKLTASPGAGKGNAQIPTVIDY